MSALIKTLRQNNTMNKRYWNLEKITSYEVYNLFLTDKERYEIKMKGVRAARLFSGLYGISIGLELQNMDHNFNRERK